VRRGEIRLIQENVEAGASGLGEGLPSTWSKQSRFWPSRSRISAIPLIEQLPAPPAEQFQKLAGDLQDRNSQQSALALAVFLAEQSGNFFQAASESYPWQLPPARKEF